MSLKDFFDPRCRRDALKLWSNWLAMVAAAAAAWAVDNQALVLGWVAEIEQPWRSLLTFVVVAVVPITIRMLRQPGLEEKEH